MRLYYFHFVFLYVFVYTKRNWKTMPSGTAKDPAGSFSEKEKEKDIRTGNIVAAKGNSYLKFRER